MPDRMDEGLREYARACLEALQRAQATFQDVQRWIEVKYELRAGDAADLETGIITRAATPAILHGASSGTVANQEPGVER